MNKRQSPFFNCNKIYIAKHMYVDNRKGACVTTESSLFLIEISLFSFSIQINRMIEWTVPGCLELVTPFLRLCVRKFPFFQYIVKWCNRTWFYRVPRVTRFSFWILSPISNSRLNIIEIGRGFPHELKSYFKSFNFNAYARFRSSIFWQYWLWLR